MHVFKFSLFGSLVIFYAPSFVSNALRINACLSTRTDKNLTPGTSALYSFTQQRYDVEMPYSGVSLQHDPLGPSSHTNALQVDGEPLKAYRVISNGNIENYEQMTHEFEVHRLSSSPHVFLLKGFMTQKECDTIMKCRGENENNNREIVVNHNILMEEASTTVGDGTILRKNSRVGWLENNVPCTSSDDDGNLHTFCVGELASAAGSILLTDEVKSLSDTPRVEKMQLLHYYDVGGEFVLHHDGVDRILTLIYYLNGVAGTWFPMAQTGDVTNNDQMRILSSVNQVREISKSLKPGRDGLVVVGKNSPILSEYEKYYNSAAGNRHVAIVEPGDCVAFFNYESGEGGIQDMKKCYNAVHAGLPTTKEEGEKVIANHWFHRKPMEYFSKN